MSDFFSNLVEPARNEAVAVSTTSIVVTQARSKQTPRKAILIRNISGDGTRISVALGLTTATANQGIILEDGESFSDTSETGYECYQGMISAIASAVTGNLAIFER